MLGNTRYYDFPKAVKRFIPINSTIFSAIPLKLSLYKPWSPYGSPLPVSIVTTQIYEKYSPGIERPFNRAGR